MFRELTAFLLCLKKRTRDDVGVVGVRHDLPELAFTLWRELQSAFQMFLRGPQSEIVCESWLGGVWGRLGMLELIEGGGRRRSQGLGGHFTLEANSRATPG